MAEIRVPLGAGTAKLFYNTPGRVIRNEISIYGYAAIKPGDAL